MKALDSRVKVGHALAHFVPRLLHDQTEGGGVAVGLLHLVKAACEHETQR